MKHKEDLTKQKRSNIKRYGSVMRNVFPSRRLSVGIERYSSGVGFIVIPPDVERDNYIKFAFQSGEVFIVTNTGEVIKDVKIPKHIIRDIVFPEESGERGSLISWTNVPVINQIVATGILFSPGEMYPYKEYEKVIEYTDTELNNEVNQLWNIRDAYVNLESYYNEQEGLVPNSARVEIKGRSPKKQSCIRLYCDGRSELYGDELSILRSEDEIQIQVGSKENETETEISRLTINRDGGFNYLDRYGNNISIDGENGTITVTTNSEINLSSERINLGEGAEAILKGDTTQTQLDVDKNKLDLLVQAIQNAPVVSGDGGASFKASIIAAISGVPSADYTNVKSNLSFTD